MFYHVIPAVHRRCYKLAVSPLTTCDAPFTHLYTTGTGSE